MDSIGERLRQERLRRGFDITHIAELTKINPGMLEAIEADDLDRLPGSFFTRSFVRQYARALGLDENEFDAELSRVTTREESEVSQPEAPHAEYAVPPVTTDSARRPGHSLGALAAFLLILAACSGIYVLWERTHEVRTEPEAAARQAPVKRTTFPTSPQPAGQTGAPAASSPVEQPAAAPAPQAAVQQPAATGAPAQTATGPVAAITKSSVPAGGSAAVSLEVQAKGEPVWVRVVGDRSVLYEGTLQPGQKLRADSAAYLRLRVGRPEGLQVYWNGKSIGEIGPAGQPQTVEFTPQRFRVVPPPPPEPTF